MRIWTDLRSELDAWETTHNTATLWWRDDDAVAETPELNRLYEIAGAYDAALCVAAIPAHVDQTIVSKSEWPVGSVLVQHGYAHENYAPEGTKKSEFGADRPIGDSVADIERGWSVINRSIHALAAFVPPWNRISDAAIQALPNLGFLGVSTFGPRKRAEPAHGLHQTNTHVDPIDWHGHRGYLGDDNAVSQVIEHLRKRRSGQVDANEPTGLLTHHLVHDEACWGFVERLAEVIAAHPGARWLHGDEVFTS